MIEHQVKVDNAGIVICTAWGKLTVESAREVSCANLTAYELGYSMLYDFSQTEVFATITDAYHFPRDRAALFGEQDQVPKKIAVVYPHGRNLDFWQFYENTARNAGLVLRVFDSLDKARDWCIHMD